jgi:Nif-specific regulatory protein
MLARLTIEAGEGAPPVCSILPNRRVSLGRSRSNSIVLQDKHASRRHAELVWVNGQWLLRDCGTLNGTMIDGERIQEPTILRDGQVIGIGDTLLRFTYHVADADHALETSTLVPGLTDLPRPQLLPDTPELSRTALQTDELSVLCDFMTDSAEEASHHALIEHALETIHRQTGATVAGYLSLDPEDVLLPRLVVPEQTPVDVHLSRKLTQRVERERRLVWLGAPGRPIVDTESLKSFNDAVCLPLSAGDAPWGALHVYKTGKLFTERDVRFCEVLAGYLASRLRVLRQHRTLKAENSRLRGHAPAAEDGFVGDSAALQQVRVQIARVAPRHNVVLIVGESGVGKECVALALHRQSPRRDGPLVIVNCAAISATLPEAELFGHRKGAFTGATDDRPGYFQQADEGTLFLDEIGELSLECQAKLLRVIEGKGFRPVGATADIHTDVRILAATHRDLEELARHGKFRQDLVFRLGIPIRIPPLRERREDIPALVNHFLPKLSAEYRRPLQLTAASMARLQACAWPGNVRQLRVVLENAVAMSDETILDADDLLLPPEVGSTTQDSPSLNLEELEARAIRQALEQTRGHVTRAAQLLGIHRDTLGAKMKKYGIEKCA